MASSTQGAAKPLSFKHLKGRLPLRLPGDSPAMTAAIEWLSERGIAVKRVSGIQLKMDALNFYPDSGTLYFDRESRLPEYGLDGLNRVLCRLRRVAELSVENSVELDE